MEKLVKLMTAVDKNVRHDDDVVDRMHHRYTVLILVVFTVFLGMKQYIGSPITCWAPKHFTGSHTKYTNSYCWVRNTYFLPLEEDIPKEHEHWKRREIIYYQWVPFILLSQAALFYAPHAIWRALNSKSGVDSDDILEVADKVNKASDSDRRQKTLTMIVNQMDRFLMNPSSNGEYSFSISRLVSKICCCICGKAFGNYLVILYIVTKLLYILNVLGQLFLLNAVLKTDYNLYGQEFIENAMNEQAFINETVFPKVTMCDFHVRLLGNVQRYTVQCLLPMNLYTEYVYVFLWFWMVFVLGLSCLSVAVYILRSLITTDRIRWIRNHLKENGRIESSIDRTYSKDFVYYYLKQDGAFILRMIAHNTNKLTTGEIICALWDNWREHRPDLKPMNNADTLPLKSLPDDDDATLPLKSGKPSLPPKPNHVNHRPRATVPSAPTLDDVDNGFSAATP